MDLSEREDTSHPVLIIFAALGLSGAVIGCVLMFRRRKARPVAKRDFSDVALETLPNDSFKFDFDGDFD